MHIDRREFLKTAGALVVGAPVTTEKLATQSIPARQVRTVTGRGGEILQFIGDAILVVFGAPLRRPDDAARAVACAVEMLNAMPGVNAWNRAHGLPEVAMGIGINTGEVVVGNIGSEKRRKP